jgi:hypothetical protein
MAPYSKTTDLIGKLLELAVVGFFVVSEKTQVVINQLRMSFSFLSFFFLSPNLQHCRPLLKCIAQGNRRSAFPFQTTPEGVE